MRKKNYIPRAVVVVAIISGTLGCAKHSSSGSTSSTTTPNSVYVAADWAACSDKIDADYAKPGANLIHYRITSHMIDPANPGNFICTPRAMRQKIKKVLDTYASIPDYNVAFKYDGEDPTIYAGTGDIPQDGNLYIALTISGAKALGTIFGSFGPANTRTNQNGSPYTTYPGGMASLPNTFLGEYYLFHEIGHALGLNHIPAHGANMSYYGGPFDNNGAGEYMSFTEQERTDLIATAPTATAKTYSITGTVQSDYLTTTCGGSVAADVADLGGLMDVVAVDTTNGRSFAALAQNNGAFWINVAAPGTYRVVAFPDTYLRSCDPTQVSSSWYVNNTTVTNNPTGGATFSLSNGSPNATGIVIKMPNMGTSMQAFDLDSHLVFPNPSIYAPAGSTSPLLSASMFLSPGDSSKFTFRINCSPFVNGNYVAISTCAQITSLTPYGTAPDYALAWTMTSSGGAGSSAWSQYNATASANNGAAPGFRLAVANANAGNTQVALMGVHILGGSTKPSSFMTSAADQLLGIFDFRTLNSLWWLP